MTLGCTASAVQPSLLPMHVAYVLLRFPDLTETFVAQEILNIQKADVQLQIFSLLQPRREPVHPAVLPLLSQVTYAPSLAHPLLWWAQVRMFLSGPRAYFHLCKLCLGSPVGSLSFSMKRAVVFLKSVWLAWKLSGENFELVHAHFAWLAGLSALVVARFLNLPYTVTAHAFDIFEKKENILALAAGQADCVVTISDYNKREMLSRAAVLVDRRIEVVRCGIDLGYFQGMPPARRSGPFQIVSVGSLIEKKGHEYLLRACAELKKNAVEFHCEIIGIGPLESALRSLIVELGLSEHVTLAGALTQSQVRDRLSVSDLFVLASVVASQGDRDGIPVAIMEAMALGVPVISTQVSGIAELVEDEVTGLLVPQRDPAAIARAVSRIKDDSALRAGMVLSARAKIEQEYDIVKNTARLAGLFQQVSAGFISRQGR